MKTNTKTVKAQLKSLKTQLKTMKEQIKALKGKAPKKVKHVARPGDYTVPRQNDGGQWGDRYPQPQPRTPQFGDRWIEG
jgi:outer membrane protein TolC